MRAPIRLESTLGHSRTGTEAAPLRHRRSDCSDQRVHIVHTDVEVLWETWRIIASTGELTLGMYVVVWAKPCGDLATACLVIAYGLLSEQQAQ
jgi:hypothetical protein